MCEYCGEKDGCKPTGGLLGHHDELSVDDWRRIYEFMKYVQLPFIHSVIVAARKRKKHERINNPDDKRLQRIS